MTIISRLVVFTCLLGSIAAAVVEGSSPEPAVQVLETRSMHELESRADNHHNNKRPHSHKKKSTQHHEQHNAPAPAHHDKRGSCKTGLGWVDNKKFQKEFLDGSCWCYSWSPWPCSTVLESVLMFWGPKQAGDWVRNTKGKHFKHILHINEPEQTGQSNIPVAYGIELWWKYMETVNADRRGSPAVTTSPAGIIWITEFVQRCKGCRIDFVNLHYYGTNAENFKELVTKVYNDVRRPIWVTEWACQDYSGHNKQCNYQQTVNFLKETQAWMDNTPWIERYAYYGTLLNINIQQTNRLMSSSGQITALGKIYLKQ